VLNDHDMEAPSQHFGKSLELMVNLDLDVYCMQANKKHENVPRNAKNNNLLTSKPLLNFKI